MPRNGDVKVIDSANTVWGHNYRQMGAVNALTDGATINTDASLGSLHTVTLGGARTMANPTNGYDGQQITYRLKQDATGGRTVSTWGSEFRFSSGVAPVLSTAAAASDHLQFIRNGTDTKWDFIDSNTVHPDQRQTNTPPAGMVGETMERWAISSNTLPGAASATMRMMAVQLMAGTVVTNVVVMIGGTGGGTLTQSWAGLYSAARAKLVVSADQTGATWTANTSRTFVLATPYVVPTDGMYYAALTIVGGTIPTFYGADSIANAVNTLPPICTGTSTTGLTDAASAPGTAAVLTPVRQNLYFYLT